MCRLDEGLPFFRYRLVDVVRVMGIDVCSWGFTFRGRFWAERYSGSLLASRV
jgi:hypothetical protein